MQKSVMLRETDGVSDAETARRMSTFLLRVLVCKKCKSIGKQVTMSILKLLKRYSDINSHVGQTFLDLSIQSVSQDPDPIVAALSKKQIREAVRETDKIGRAHV